MQSTKKLVRKLCWSLTAVLALQTPFAYGEMLGPEAAMAPEAPSQAEADRAKLQQFLDRANVKEKLQAMGVSGLNARDRVASLSEQEVHALAQRIDTMPAGGSLSQSDLILILLVAILIIVAI